MSAEQLFWICLGLVAYTFAGYPLLVALLARWRGGEPVGTAAELPPITVVIAARNEAARIAARLHNLLAGNYPPEKLAIVLVDDGSDDATASIAKALGDPRVRVLRQHPAQGKAVALNLAMAQVDTELTVYADVRQDYTGDTLEALVTPFCDPRVAVVSGEVQQLSASELGHPVAAEGSYARIERALRAGEARLGWAHGASGAVYAIRSEVFRPLPAGLILDDVYTPAQALRTGQWVWVTRSAIAVDSVGNDLRHEFRRKLRTLTGNWQVLAALPWLLSPWHNPTWFAWVSHKLARLLAPWALLGALLGSALALDPVVHAAFWLQLGGYAIALLSVLAPRLATPIPLAATAGSFVTLNAAALLSLPLYLGSSQLGHLWRR